MVEQPKKIRFTRKARNTLLKIIKLKKYQRNTTKHNLDKYIKKQKERK